MRQKNLEAPLGADHRSYPQILASLRPAFLGVMVFSAVINLLMLTGSVYMLQVYDRVLSSGSVPTLVALFAVVVILYGFLGFYDFARVRLLSRMALQLDHHMGRRAFHTWIGTGESDSRQDGNIQPLRDLEGVRSFLSGPAITALFDLPFVPLFLAVLFIVHSWLGWLTVAGAGVAAVLALINRAVTSAPIQQASGLDNTERCFADQGRRCSDAVIAMGMQDALTRRWSTLHRTTLAGGQKAGDPSEGLAAFSRAFRMLLQSAILTLGAFLVLRNEISAGMIIAASILSGRALAPLDQVIGQWRMIGRSLAAHKRLKSMFSVPLATAEQIDLPNPTGQISVRNLTKLGAEKALKERHRILSQVSFDLEPGDGLGVIGSSGSGKSTLARLLVGALRADEGEIRLDGATPDQWHPERLGRQVGYLPQTPELLPGTIRDNIARFDAETDDAAVIAAAKMTGVHDMILALPQGYGTQVGVPGQPQPLSGGQLQRVGLARAVCGMPKFVVLDEPNSNLDRDGEEALTRVIAELRRVKSTVIVMAHHPSALMAVNMLLMLEAGKMRIFGHKDRILAGDVTNATIPNAKLGQHEENRPVPRPEISGAPTGPVLVNQLRPVSTMVRAQASAKVTAANQPERQSA